MNSVRIVTIVGNRPQFVKAAAVSRLLRERHEELLVHTGQHYDDELSQVFFEELGMPAPDRELGTGDGSNTEQTARMLAALEPVLARAAARPRARLRRHQLDARRRARRGPGAACRSAHVEAGMRSFDRAMPEELNRVLTDHASDLLLCSTQTAIDNLAREGVRGRGAPGGRRDGRRVARASRRSPRERSTIARRPRRSSRASYLLVTAHRAGNVDDPARLARLVDLLEALPAARGVPGAPAHPRPAGGGRAARRALAGCDARRRRSATSTSSSWRATRARS